MFGDSLYGLLEDFERPVADNWVVYSDDIHSDDVAWVPRRDGSRFSRLWNDLIENGYFPLVYCDRPDDGLVVILSYFDGIGVIDVMIGEQRWYKFFGDPRMKGPYDYDNPVGRASLYRAFIDMVKYQCMAASKDSVFGFVDQLAYLKSLSYKEFRDGS